MLRSAHDGRSNLLDSDRDREELFRLVNVPREVVSKLERYHELLISWNEKFNLIGANTVPYIWRRHFLDSAQLVKYLPSHAKRLCDMGSGAGFPGIILAIIGFPEVHLIESVAKKANFLSMLIEDMNLNCKLRHTRIESLHNEKFDVLTARALKPLPQLLKFSKPLMKKDSICLFLKGQNLNAELTEASKYWKFDSEIFPSLSDHSGRVLKIAHLSSRK